MSHIIAVDIGGTQIRTAAFEPDSTQLVTHQRMRTLGHEPGVFDRLVQAIEAVWQADVAAIGIASPGPLDPHTGTILSTPNIPQWKDFPLTANLAQHFGVPVFLDNDANMAGLGEWQFGAGKGHRDLLYLTIRTGIGGGVSQVGDLLFKPFEESLRTHVFHPHHLDDLVITKAALGDDAGLLGAFALARLASTSQAELKE